MIDNEAIQEQLEAEQQPEDELSALEAALGAALLLSLASLYGQFDAENGFQLNPRKRKRLFAQLGDIIGAHYMKVQSLVESNMRSAFERAYETFMGAFEEELGLPLELLLTDDVVEEVLKSGFPLQKTMRHNQQATTKRLRREIQEIVRRNEPLQDATRRMQETAQNDSNRVRVVVQEETARVQNEAQTQSIADAEVQGASVDVIWNSMRDNKVRRAHQTLHGQKADAEGWFYVDGDKAKHPHGFSKIGLNINCRCYLEIRGVGVADSETARALNSAESSSARREEWERRRALARERARGDIS